MRLNKDNPRLIHVETAIQVTFGVLDADGNLRHRHPLNTTITIPSELLKPEAYEQFVKEFEAQAPEIIRQMDESASPQE